MSFDEMNKLPNKYQKTDKELMDDIERIKNIKRSKQVQKALDMVRENQYNMDDRLISEQKDEQKDEQKWKNSTGFERDLKRLQQIKNNKLVSYGQLAGKPLAYHDLGMLSQAFGMAALPGHAIGFQQRQLRAQEAKQQSKQLGIAGKAFRTSQMLNTALAAGSSASYLGAALGGYKIPSIRSAMTTGIGKGLGFSGEKFMTGTSAASAGTNTASTIASAGTGQGILSSVASSMSPAMLAGMAAPIALSIATSMWKGSKQKRLRGEPPIVSDIIQKYSRTKGIMQQTTMLLRSGQVKPGEALMIQVSKITADNTGALLAMYEIMETESQSKEKDAVTAIDDVYDSTLDKSWIENLFDSTETRFNKFMMAYNPLAQLGAMIGGKTPLQAIREIGNEPDQKDVNITAKEYGISTSRVRYLNMDSGQLSMRATTYPGKELAISSGIYDINRFMLQELMLIRKYGHHLDDQGLDTESGVESTWDLTKQWFSDLSQSIPMLSAGLNLTKLAIKGITGGFNIIDTMKTKFIDMKEKSIELSMGDYKEDKFSKLTNEIMKQIGFFKDDEQLALDSTIKMPEIALLQLAAIKRIGEDVVLSLTGQTKIHTDLVWDPVGGTYIPKNEIKKIRYERSKTIEQVLLGKDSALGKKEETAKFKLQDSSNFMKWLYKSSSGDTNKFDLENHLSSLQERGYDIIKPSEIQKMSNKSKRFDSIQKINSDQSIIMNNKQPQIQLFNNKCSICDLINIIVSNQQKLIPYFDNNYNVIDAIEINQIETIDRVAEMQQMNQDRIDKIFQEESHHRVETIDRVAEMQQMNQDRIDKIFQEESHHRVETIDRVAEMQLLNQDKINNIFINNQNENSTFAKEKAEFSERKMNESKRDVYKIIKEYLPKISKNTNNLTFKDKIKSKSKGILDWIFNKIGLSGLFTTIGSTVIGGFLWKYIKKGITRPFKEMWSAFSGIFLGKRGIITRFKILFRNGWNTIKAIFTGRKGIAAGLKTLFSLKSLKSLFGFKSIMRLFASGVKRNPITGIVFGAIDAVIDMWSEFKKGGIKGLIKGIFKVDSGGGIWSALKASSKYGFYGALIGAPFAGVGAIPGFFIGQAIGAIIGWVGGENWSKAGKWVGEIMSKVGNFFKDIFAGPLTMKMMDEYGSKVPILGHIAGYVIGSTVTVLTKIFDFFDFSGMYKKVKEWINENMPWPIGHKKPIVKTAKEINKNKNVNYMTSEDPLGNSLNFKTQNKISRQQKIDIGPDSNENYYNFFKRLNMTPSEIITYKLKLQKNKHPLQNFNLDDSYNKLLKNDKLQLLIDSSKKFTDNSLKDIQKNKIIIDSIKKVETLKNKSMLDINNQIDKIRDNQLTKKLVDPLITELQTVSDNIIQSTNATITNTSNMISRINENQSPVIQPQIKQAGEESYGSSAVDKIVKTLFQENVIGLPERIITYTIGAENINV